MNRKLQFLFVICLFMGSMFTYGQQVENKPQGPIYVGAPTRVEQVPSIASRSNLPSVDLLSKTEEMKDGRSYKYDVVIGKGSKGADALAANPHRLKNKIPTKAPSLVFETAASNSQPTDPAGAVGPNHYIAVTNTAFRIFDKSGNPLTALLPPNPTIFPSGGCCDLTASYDNAADRWVLSFLGGGVQIAVSNGPDPVNDGWTTYTYAVVNDYQKLSVWSDGYYMTENTNAGEKLHVFDRTAMLNGDATAAIQSFVLPGLVTSGFHSPQVLNISNGNTPAVGNATVVYMQDDAWGGVSNDHIKLWNVDIDFATPANSVVSAAVELGNAQGVTDFTSVFDGGSFVNLAQPSGGTSIDALQATIMNQAQFRKFPTHNSAVFNFVVDVDPSATKQAGIRWYELRQAGDGQPWTVHQEGTYTAPDNRHAWHASMIMDVQGNIGMGYTTMSSPNSSDANFRVSSMYTGRFASDPLGTMTVAEETIIIGDANIPGTRYGDYSKIDVDPANDKTFWFVNEVMQGGRKNICGVFQIAPNTSDDVGVVSVDTPTSGALTNAETVTVTVFNFGENDASGFNVTYQVDGGATITEAFVGTLASGTSAQHTFATTADLSNEGQTYTINACTDLTGDEDTGNDCTSADVIHVLANDIGVTAITAPTSGEGLGNEVVTITIENFGTADQSGFNVNYILDGGTPVVETVAATVPAGGSISYSFTQTANLSMVGDYTISATTLLGSDADNSNDMMSIMVTNISCMSMTSSDTPLSIGPDAATETTSTITFTDDFVINDVNVTINIEHTWDADLDVKLIAPDGTTEVVLFEDVGGSGDDFTGTILDSEAAQGIADGSAPFTGTFSPQGNLGDLNGLSSLGDWTLSITDDANGDGGQLLDWSLQLCGNMNLSIDDNDFAGELEIIHEGNGLYQINLPTTSMNEKLDLTVFNVVGQKVYWRTLENESGTGYQHQLDMSYASSGVYLVRLGDDTSGTYKRIIVE